jgi:hypothetical protein
MSPEVQAAIITSATTAVAAAIGFTAVVIQIGAQARAAIDANRDNEARRLRVQVYQDVSTSCQLAADAWIELNSLIRNLLLQVRQARVRSDAGLPFTAPTVYSKEIMDQCAEAGNTTVQLVRAAERWRVIDARLRIFQTAFSSSAHDVRAAFYKDLIPKLIPAAPLRHPVAGQSFPWSPPPEADLKDLEQLGETTIGAVTTVVSYVDDFQNAMQNLLLGDLFGNRVEHRKPLDPAFRAITLDDHEALDRYFRNDTPWGTSVAEAEARVAASKSESDA